MFVLCPHCHFLVGMDPRSGRPPAACPKCHGVLAEADRGVAADAVGPAPLDPFAEATLPSVAPMLADDALPAADASASPVAAPGTAPAEVAADAAAVPAAASSDDASTRPATDAPEPDPAAEATRADAARADAMIAALAPRRARKPRARRTRAAATGASRSEAAADITTGPADPGEAPAPAAPVPPATPSLASRLRSWFSRPAPATGPQPAAPVEAPPAPDPPEAPSGSPALSIRNRRRRSGSAGGQASTGPRATPPVPEPPSVAASAPAPAASEDATPAAPATAPPGEPAAGAGPVPGAIGPVDSGAHDAPDAAGMPPVVPEPASAPPPLPAPLASPVPTAAAAQRPAPSFATARPGTRTPRHELRMLAAAAGLALLLAAQLLLAQRDALSADAKWRPALATLCSVLRCELPPWREPAAFTMLSRHVRPHPGAPGTLRVDASFRNDARWPQPWPRLQLSLADIDGRVVGARSFAPAEYLGTPPSQPLLAPGQTAAIHLAVVEPAPDIVAFSFDFR